MTAVKSHQPSSPHRVITGQLSSRMITTGRLFDSMFSAHLTLSNGLITRYRVQEDSWGLDEAPGEVEAVAPREGMSPYPTGAGGVTFERNVAVQYLAHLIVGDGAVELGDGRSVVSVAFQQAPDHPVDDLVVRALAPTS